MTVRVGYQPTNNSKLNISLLVDNNIFVMLETPQRVKFNTAFDVFLILQDLSKLKHVMG